MAVERPDLPRESVAGLGLFGRGTGAGGAMIDRREVISNFTKYEYFTC